MDYVESLAAAALGAGLGLREGDLLRIKGEPPHRELMLAAAREAYRRGARYVRVDYDDKRLTRARIDHSRAEYLGAVPRAVEADFLALRDEGWLYLVVQGPEDTAALDGAEPSRIYAADKALSAAATPYRKALMANAQPWCVVPCPTDSWARSALANPEARAEDLWRSLAPILRLDSADPAEALQRDAWALASRVRSLQSLDLTELRFRGGGTDLRVPLSPRALWRGGGSVSNAGRDFIPNIPTEETFTTPDARRTEGRAVFTRPVEIMGVQVEGGWLEFRSGKVVACGASRNASALEGYLDTDSGARSLGEVALVDSSSPVWRSGIVFGSVLLDENAACHIALGSAYPDAFDDYDALNDIDRAALGFNESVVHLDCMIGSEEVEVEGIDRSGRAIPLIVGGASQIKG
ncbi:MAG: aminopeptidase [Spirochaetaceae bacterium]|nr:aminopeptidase [Spirochaetaceae bacterium]